MEYYRGLVSLRKQLPGLCDKSPSANRRIMDGKIHGDGVVSFRVDNKASRPSRWEELFIIYNASPEEHAIGLPGHVEPAAGKSVLSEKGRTQDDIWEVLADGNETDCRKKTGITGNRVRVAAGSGMLLGRPGPEGARTGE